LGLFIKHGSSSGRAFPATILGLLLIAVAASFFTYNFRIVKTTGGFRMIEKSQPALESPYVDITDWGVKELYVFRNITYEVIHAGYGSEIPQVAMFNHAVDQGVQSVNEFDARYGVSGTAAEGYQWTIEQMRQIDRKYEIREGVNAAMEEAQRIDEEYMLSEGAKEGLNKAREAARELWEKVQDDQG